jgi:hypothetical protein
MKKLFLLGFIALMAVACNNKNSENKTDKETEDSKKEGSSLKDMIVGTWTLTSVNGDTIPEDGETVDVKFNADGTAEGAGDGTSKWETKEKDGKKYIIVTIDNETEETEIKSIDAKTMVLLDKDDEITFSKK